MYLSKKNISFHKVPFHLNQHIYQSDAADDDNETMKEIHEFLIKIEVPLYKIFHFIKILFKSINIYQNCIRLQ